MPTVNRNLGKASAYAKWKLPEWTRNKIIEYFDLGMAPSSMAPVLKLNHGYVTWIVEQSGRRMRTKAESMLIKMLVSFDLKRRLIEECKVTNYEKPKLF